MMRTMHRPGLGSNPEWKDYRLKTGAANQWDEVSGTLEGWWDSPYAANQALKSKRIVLPGQTGGYGFYLSGNDIETYWLPGGRVGAQFTARGLVGQKFKRVDSSQVNQYSLSDITIPGLGSGLPGGTYEKLDFRYVSPQVDVTVAYLPSGTNLIDYSNIGKPITSHWAATLAGLTLSDPGSNPFTSGDFTYHYPYGWSYEIIPGDRMGPNTGGLAISTFRFSHNWNHTL